MRAMDRSASYPRQLERWKQLEQLVELHGVPVAIKSGLWKDVESTLFARRS